MNMTLDEIRAMIAMQDANKLDINKQKHNAIINAFLAYSNYHEDYIIHDEAELIKECGDIAPQFNSIDESGNAIHCYLYLDTCDIDIIAFFDDKGYIQDIRISQDNMPYEMMICDPMRKAN